MCVFFCVNVTLILLIDRNEAWSKRHKVISRCQLGLTWTTDELIIVILFSLIRYTRRRRREKKRKRTREFFSSTTTTTERRTQLSRSRSRLRRRKTQQLAKLMILVFCSLIDTTPNVDANVRNASTSFVFIELKKLFR